MPAATDEANLRLAISMDVNSARYIIWDAETDTSTGVHLPNLIVVEVLEVDGDNDYIKSMKSRKIFRSYDCLRLFCEWLFTEENEGSIVIAHNGGGYDHKFVLKYALERLLPPTTYICQGSHITYMRFRKFNLQFKDSWIFSNRNCRLCLRPTISILSRVTSPIISILLRIRIILVLFLK